MTEETDSRALRYGSAYTTPGRTIFADEKMLACLRANRATAVSSNGAATYATLREIDNRRKSIKNIQKITSTMKIVASTKLNRAQRTMTESRKYGETASEVFQAAETAVPEVEQKKTLIIVCSSDKGLCGGVHSGLSRRIRAYANETTEPFDLVVVGEKCKAQLLRTSPDAIQMSFAGIGKDIPTFADAQAIADQVVMNCSDYTDVKILYNKFVNAQSYEPTFIQAFSEQAIAQSRMCPGFRIFRLQPPRLMLISCCTFSQHFCL